MKFKSLFKYIFLFLIMASVSQWGTFSLYFSSLGQKGQLLQKITDSPLIETIYRNTNLKISYFNIVNSPRPYGLMVGLPNKPYMVLSSYLYQNFSDSEIEYVITHEAAHYLLKHTTTEMIAFSFLFIIGCLILRNCARHCEPEQSRRRGNLVFPIFIGFVFGLLMIQLGRLHELEADRFTARHMSDPQGMIAATNKFQNYYGIHYTKEGILGNLFYRSNPYGNRLKIAQEEIDHRKL